MFDNSLSQRKKKKKMNCPPGYDEHVWSSLDSATRREISLEFQTSRLEAEDAAWSNAVDSSSPRRENSVHEEFASAADDSDVSSDEGDEIVLLARFAKVELKNRPKSSSSKQKREVERVKAEHEESLKAQKQSEKKHSKLNAAERRLQMSMQSIEAADSGAKARAEAAAKAAEKTEFAEDDAFSTADEVDFRFQMARAQTCSDNKDRAKTIEALVRALELAKRSGNAKGVLSASAWLGQECLDAERTRDAILYFDQAISFAQRLHVDEAQLTALVAALVNAYLNVGDRESASAIAKRFGRTVSDVLQVQSSLLPASLVQNIEDALQRGIQNDLEPLRMIVASFVRSDSKFSKAIVEYSHRATGIQPLHVAAGRDDTQLVEELIEHGAPLGGKDKAGTTPIFWAARFGGAQALAVLYNHGARFDEDKMTKVELEKWPVHVKQVVGQLIAEG